MDNSTLQAIERRLSAGRGLFDSSKPPKSVVIIGVGNLTQSDDGLGVQVTCKLMNDPSLRKQADIFETGNRVFEFLECLDGRKKAIIIDAYEGGKEPGFIHRLVFNINDFDSELEIPISFHDFTFVDAILSAMGAYTLPQEIIVLGIEPLKLDAGMELSLPVKRSLPKLIETVKEEVRRCQ